MRRLLCAVVALTAACLARADVTLENVRFRLVVGDDAIVRSLRLKATGEELLDAREPTPLFSVTQPRPFNNEIKLAYPNARTTYPANRLRRDGDRLVVGFEIAPYEAAVDVKVTDDYIAFTLADFILSAWAWGASRVMDWIETEPTLDARHVAVVGHSRGGKTALLTGVTDARFAMACVNDSGCCGAKLNHMDLPLSEHYDQIAVLGSWFCGNFMKHRRKEHLLPFDAHMWAALMAPRLLAIGSATEDHWAGQEGEFQTGRLASPAWELYGRKGLVGTDFPPPDTPLQEGSVSYHLRTGIHNLTPYDWDRYMDFADRQNWR